MDIWNTNLGYYGCFHPFVAQSLQYCCAVASLDEQQLTSVAERAVAGVVEQINLELTFLVEAFHLWELLAHAAVEWT